jgi:flavodoxin
MNILILYETYSGRTMIAAEFAVSVLQKKGHTATILQTHLSDPQTYPQYDLIIMATPSWLERGEEGQPHIYILRFMDDMKDTTFKGKFAFFGLGDSTYAHFGQGVESLEAFMKARGATVVLPLLKIDSSLFDEEKSKELLSQWLETLPLL